MTMQPFTIVTGNQHKLAELTRLLPADLKFDHKALDLEEIQSFDSAEIVTRKVKQAYDLVGRPVIVEDVTAGLQALNGLPGPFIKFFVEQLGRDALYTLSKDDKRATVTCTIGYYDGVQLFTVSADCAGTIVKMKSDAGFGIDGTFIPDGQTKTFAEMTAAEKDQVSHRGKAVTLFLEQLQAE